MTVSDSKGNLLVLLNSIATKIIQFPYRNHKKKTRLEKENNRYFIGKGLHCCFFLCKIPDRLKIK